THTFKADQPTLLDEIRALTEGRGADAAFEVVGISPTLNLTVKSLRRGGTAVLVGNLSPKVELPLQLAVTNEITLVGSCGSAGEYRLCLDLIAQGNFQLDQMIAAVAPLSDGAEWFEKLSAKDGSRYMKVILEP